MFNIGSRYRFQMIIDGEETSFSGVIERYEHPLIKLEDTNIERLRVVLHGEFNTNAEEEPLFEAPAQVIPGKVINVTSANFISAEEDRQA